MSIVARNKFKEDKLMNKLIPVEFKNQRIMTTKVLSKRIWYRGKEYSNELFK